VLMKWTRDKGKSAQRLRRMAKEKAENSAREKAEKAAEGCGERESASNGGDTRICDGTQPPMLGEHRIFGGEVIHFDRGATVLKPLKFISYGLVCP
jgi:hypothetical protein